MSHQSFTRVEELFLDQMPAIMPLIYFNIPLSTSYASNATDDERRCASEHGIKVGLQALETARSQATTFKQNLIGRVDGFIQQLRGYTASSITDDVLRDMTLDLIKSGVKAVFQDRGDDEILILTSKEEFETMLDDEEDEDMAPPTPFGFSRSSIPSLDATFDSKGVVIATWEMPGSILKAVTLQSFHPDRLTDPLIQTVEAPLMNPSE